jgi:hypothetical protein
MCLPADVSGSTASECSIAVHPYPPRTFGSCRRHRLEGVLPFMHAGDPTFRSAHDELRSLAVSKVTRHREVLTDPEAIHGARALLAEEVGKFPLNRVEGKGGMSYKASGTIDFFGEGAFTQPSGAGGQNSTLQPTIRFSAKLAA